MPLFNKFKKWFRGLWHRRGYKINIQAESTPEPGNVAQDFHGSQDSVSHISAQSEPIPGRMPDNSVLDTSQLPQAAAEQKGGQVSSTAHQALQTAGAVAETSLKILKELSEFIPVAGQGLGIALGAVSECVKIYHQVTENKERFKELTEELSTKLAEVKNYMEQSGSTEMDEIFQILAEYGSVLTFE
ncbi:hypothetical protein GYMLUDRAFT_404627 [Collybiopsis luxurians FD-317 M1]|uniref:Uncharacterized protein n=1 Tax=Collybiopsis luxurians FD-317 M1 TaxID=944289 RepID=A0A0D0BNU7_9AGAR|nr:hypothetical protein GYMLUDRAFT_404627 [Collybiopsis luxurians FD-317 M1]